MMFNLDQCEQCEEPAVVCNEDGEALCEDCIFEQTCDAMFGVPEDEL
jgi:hypothetical protein